MGNSLLTGLDLLRARERQSRLDQQAEEQQEIENLQAQKAQSLADKEQKRAQSITDLNSKVLERKFALDTAIERLQFEEGQAIGRTPSEATFQVPEVSEEFTGPREGGIIGRQDTSGLAGPFGAPSFQPEARQNELIQAFGINQQLQAMQQREKALASPTFLAGQQAGLFRADLAENARLNQIETAKELQKDKLEIERLKGKNKIDAVERRGQLQLQREAIKNQFGDERTMRGQSASILHGNSDLTGPISFRMAVLRGVQELGTELAIGMGFSPEQVSKVSFQDVGTKVKQDILELAPVLTTLDEIKLLLDEGIDKGWFPENLPLAAIRKSIEGVKGIFGQSEMAIRLEELIGRAATVARSVGEKRFTEGDIARAVQLMLSPGLRAKDGERRYKALRGNARFVFESRTRGINPIQLAIMFGPDFQSKLGIDISKIKETGTSSTLAADSSTRGPNERAVKDAEGNLLWFDTKTGKRRERSK